MIKVSSLEVRGADLDQSSSGMGIAHIRQLFGDGILLANALEFIEWDERAAQMIVCEQCGMVGCADGGWVAFRSSGDLVLLIPAFSAMTAPDEDQYYAYKGYQPPAYLRNLGIMYLERPQYERLCSLHSVFPPRESLFSLSGRELAWVTQWEAPARAWGSFPEPGAPRRELLVASSEQLGDTLATLSDLLDRAQETQSEVTLVPCSPSSTVVSLFVDIPGIPEWKVLVNDGGQCFLYVEPGFMARM
ncbi:MAG: hypothetical protein JXL80_08875 [Planctomycetes bacterium]|nr:hypothetical protein [Planctomycetota bacterium]